MFLFVRYRCYRLTRGCRRRGEGTQRERERDVATGSRVVRRKVELFFLFVDFFVMLIAEEIRKEGFRVLRGRI